MVAQVSPKTEENKTVGRFVFGGMKAHPVNEHPGDIDFNVRNRALSETDSYGRSHFNKMRCRTQSHANECQRTDFRPMDQNFAQSPWRLRR
jgi:hypothetical protein